MDFSTAAYNNNSPDSGGRYSSGMAVASLITGLLSILMCCTGFLSIIFGALGIIFAALSRGRDRRFLGTAVAGLITGLCGLVLGISLTAFSFVFMNRVMEDPSMREQLDPMFEQTYGMSFEELMEQFGYTFDD
ncbi:MAG: DUF4190 domain-containing protein [Ruminococcus sp.]|nr:DUF4190 domain-containing protein [Ruminococcus sp.]MBR1476382.1 DUF4190 domain-containing protein [Lachnospiraceae bacterium]